MALLQKLNKQNIQRFLVFLLSLCSGFIFSLGYSSVNAASPFDYRAAKSWVCTPDTNSGAWISGTSSAHGNIYCGITINAQDEFIDIYGNNSSVGYNAGLVVVDFLIKSGDNVSFNYSIGSFGDKYLLYGLKRAVNTSGIYTSQNYYQAADFVYTENAVAGSGSINFTAEEDSYFFMYMRNPANSLECHYNISNITISNSSGSTTINFNDIVTGAVDKINEKLGVLTFGEQVLIDFFNLFEPNDNTSLVFPGFTIKVANQDYKVWDDISYDLKDVENNFSFLISTLRTMLVVLVYLALLRYAADTFERIFNK